MQYTFEQMKNIDDDELHLSQLYPLTDGEICCNNCISNATINMYPTWMYRLFLYFDLWGFTTQFKASRSKLNDNNVFIIHIILALLASFFIVLYLIRPNDDEIARLADYLKFSVLFVVYWLSLIELNSKKDVQRKFWHHVHTIDQYLCSHRQFRLTNYLKKLRIYFSFVGIAFAMYLYRTIHYTGTNVLFFWVSYMFSIIFFKTRSFYYIFFLEFIKNELKIIDREAAALLKDCNAATTTENLSRLYRLTKSFRLSRFKWIRKYYGLVFDLCHTVNAMFGWSNIVVILFTFHLILMDINWAYWKLLNRYPLSVNGKFGIFAWIEM